MNIDATKFRPLSASVGRFAWNFLETGSNYAAETHACRRCSECLQVIREFGNVGFRAGPPDLD